MVIDYLHDPLGRRIAKLVNGAVTEKYLWQGLTRLLAVYDGGDNLVMRFEYADGRMPVAMARGGATYYLTYHQVGSLRVVADSSSNVVKRIDYDSFGNSINDSNPTFTIPFGFAGGLHDRDTGLLRFGFRDYDPDVGRWTAKDPIGFLAGDVDFYGYVQNNPINFIDPLGLEKLIKIVKKGTLADPLYGATITVTDGKAVLFTGLGSTFPDDPKNKIIKPGTYTGKVAEMDTKKLLGIFFTGKVPAVKEGVETTAKGIFIHCGRKNRKKLGSTACPTIDPAQDKCIEFFEHFKMGEEVKIEIVRVR